MTRSTLKTAVVNETWDSGYLEQRNKHTIVFREATKTALVGALKRRGSPAEKAADKPVVLPPPKRARCGSFQWD